MSRAFMSEEAQDRQAAQLAERPVSPHPNLVTPNGLARIEVERAAIQSALLVAPPDDEARPRLLRDLRYWQSRSLSARVVTPLLSPPEEVVFGVLVTVRRGTTTSRFRIVGEDEADPADALLSYVSPLAEAVLGAREGDIVELGGGRDPVEVLAIER